MACTWVRHMAGLLASMLKWSRTEAASLAALGPVETCTDQSLTTSSWSHSLGLPTQAVIQHSLPGTRLH